MTSLFKPNLARPAILVFIATLALVLFYLLQHYLFTQELSSIQLTINNSIIKLQSKPLNALFILITSSGNYIPITILTLIISIFLFKYYYRLESIFFLLNSICLISINSLVKQHFQRARPNFNPLIAAEGYSFPSGHAMVNLGIGIFLCYLVFKLIEYKRPAIIFSTIIFSYCILIGFSRVYVGVHFLGDVFGGWLLAIATTLFLIAIYEIINYKQLNKNIYYRRH